MKGQKGSNYPKTDEVLSFFGHNRHPDFRMLFYIESQKKGTAG
ncbi:hypothetical protein HMPREF3201_00609 [Megasphaera sp. MJR8396C]|nr:hypothetical protein HMPREF3201_00609 [Megasphaera sp. MJR8396C]